MELLDAYQRLEIAMKLGKGRNKKAKEGGYAEGRATFGYKVRKAPKSSSLMRNKRSLWSVSSN